MVVIPAGKFRMGFDGGEEGRPEGPVHDVHIGYSFAIGKFEVTQEQFADFVRDSGYAMRGGCQVWQGEWKNPPDADWINPGYGGVPFDDEPVACVSWKDAEAYVEVAAPSHRQEIPAADGGRVGIRGARAARAPTISGAMNRI